MLRSLGQILLLLVFSVPILAQQPPDWDKVQIKVQRVAGSVYMLEGRGGNIGALVGEDGGMKEGTSFDGVHPNAKGYAIMAPLAQAAIDKVVGGK